MTQPRASIPLRRFRVLDLFSAAAGGWTLGLDRAGFVTVAACEIVEWRRVLYAENNPDVLIYEDVRSLTAARLVSDLGFLPDIIVGSPPCQDISSANTKGKGIDGERSGLYLEAVRLVGGCRPRWFAFENSANLRTRGADRLLAALEAFGYACEPCVVGADNVGANHVRKRSWLIGFDPGQLADTHIAIAAGRPPSGGRIGRAQGDEGVGTLRSVPRTEAADTDGNGRDAGRRRGRRGIDISAAHDLGDAAQDGRGSRRARRRAQSAARPCEPSCRDDGNANSECGSAGKRAAQAQGPDDVRSGQVRPDANHERGAAYRQDGDAARHDADACETERWQKSEPSRDRERQARERREGADRHAQPSAPRGNDAADASGVRLWQQQERIGAADAFNPSNDPRNHYGNAAHADEARQPDGCVESGLRSAEIAVDGCGDGRCDDGPGAGQMGGRPRAGDDAAEPWADWNGGLAHHLRLDDGLSAWLVGARIALGSPKGTSAASLIVEAFGDAVLPQVPEAIGRAILRTEAALDAVIGAIRSVPLDGNGTRGNDR